MYQPINAQESKVVKIHSHNDYLQKLPFWTAYGSDLNSIEVDVFLKDGVLFATHSRREIIEKHTLENLYIKPLQDVFTLNIGRRQNIQLLIDIKSEAITTLDEIIKVLNKYPDVMDNKSISFVISGNRPSPEKYADYPEYIQFDYQSLYPALLKPEIWGKVALISMNFNSIFDWKAIENLPEKDMNEIATIIAKAHELGKPFRFWGCPGTPIAWRTFIDLGMDYLHTDKPYECSKYLSSSDFGN